MFIIFFSSFERTATFSFLGFFPLFFLLFDFGRAGTVAVPADLLLVLAVDDVVVVFLVVFVLVLVFLNRVLVLLVIKGLADGLCPNVALL